MTVRLNLTPEIEAGLLAQAQAEGLTLEQFLDRAVRSLAQPDTPAIPQDSEEWTRSFDAWVHSHDQDNLPILSDEAISREFIYRDRGL
jgi:hypothetical protein